MRNNKLTPGSNLMWESSRMMLPEHKEQILGHRRDLGKRERPIPDNQQLEEWSHTMAACMEKGRKVTVTVFDAYEDVRLFGTVARVDPIMRQIKFQHSDGKIVWVRLGDITGIDAE